MNWIHATALFHRLDATSTRGCCHSWCDIVWKSSFLRGPRVLGWWWCWDNMWFSFLTFLAGGESLLLLVGVISHLITGNYDFLRIFTRNTIHSYPQSIRSPDGKSGSLGTKFPFRPWRRQRTSIARTFFETPHFCWKAPHPKYFLHCGSNLHFSAMCIHPSCLSICGPSPPPYPITKNMNCGQLTRFWKTFNFFHFWMLGKPFFHLFVISRPVFIFWSCHFVCSPQKTTLPWLPQHAPLLAGSIVHT